MVIQGIDNILGTIYLEESLAIQAPVNKLIARKCNQITNISDSLA